MLQCCHTGDLKNTRRYLQTCIHTFYLYFKVEVQCPRVAMLIYNHGQKSWDTFAFLGRFQFTQVQPLPSPHKQCSTRVSRIFSEFQLCIGWGEGRTARKCQTGCTALRGNREMIEKYEYCSTVPRTFVQDCTKNPGFR